MSFLSGIWRGYQLKGKMRWDRKICGKFQDIGENRSVCWKDRKEHLSGRAQWDYQAELSVPFEIIGRKCRVKPVKLSCIFHTVLSCWGFRPRYWTLLKSRFGWLSMWRGAGRKALAEGICAGTTSAALGLPAGKDVGFSGPSSVSRGTQMSGTWSALEQLKNKCGTYH